VPRNIRVYYFDNRSVVCPRSVSRVNHRPPSVYNRRSRFVQIFRRVPVLGAASLTEKNETIVRPKSRKYYSNSRKKTPAADNEKRKISKRSGAESIRTIVQNYDTSLANLFPLPWRMVTNTSRSRPDRRLIRRRPIVSAKTVCCRPTPVRCL